MNWFGFELSAFLLVFVLLNVANVIIQTVKSIATIKCGAWAAAIINAVAYGLYTIVVVYMTADGLGLFWKALIIGIANLVGVYVHWNGGNDSIVPFCRACKEIGFRCPTYDFAYGVARFVQLVANFFGGCSDCSVGVDTLNRLDTNNFDNGVYIIGEDWEIVGREFGGDADFKLDEKDVEEFIKYLVDTQKGIDALKEKLDKEMN